MPHRKINNRVVVFDAADVEAESRFWADGPSPDAFYADPAGHPFRLCWVGRS